MPQSDAGTESEEAVVDAGSFMGAADAGVTVDQTDAGTNDSDACGIIKQ